MTSKQSLLDCLGSGELGWVQPEFWLVSSFSYWEEWWYGLLFSLASRVAVDPLWNQEVRGTNRFAIHFPFISQFPTFTFRSREVRGLLLDLNSYGGTDPIGMSNLYFDEERWCSGPSSRCGILPASSFG